MTERTSEKKYETEISLENGVVKTKRQKIKREIRETGENDRKVKRDRKMDKE